MPDGIRKRESRKKKDWGVKKPMSEEVKKEVNAEQEEFDEEAYWDEIEEEEEEEAKKRRVKIVIGIIVAILVVIAAGAYVFVSKAGKYQEAAGLYAEGQYAEAAAAFESAGSFQDAAAMAAKSYYIYGQQLLEAGDNEGARAAFAAAGDYDNAPDMVVKLDYKHAIALLNAGETEAALEQFATLGDYNQTEYYVAQAAIAGKYANCESEAAGDDSFSDWRAAENALTNVLYGTWYNEEGKALEITATTINGQGYTIDKAEGYEKNIKLSGVLADGSAYELKTMPAFAGPVDAVVFTDGLYFNATAEQLEAALEARANGEYAEYEVAQKYADEVVIQKALDLFVAEAPAQEAAEAEEGLMGKVMGLVPAHYVAKEAAVEYDAVTATYIVDMKAAYVTNLKDSFNLNNCETTAVTAAFKDAGTKLEVLAFASGAEAEAVEAAMAEAAEQMEAAEIEAAEVEEAVEAEAPAEAEEEVVEEAPAEEAEAK